MSNSEQEKQSILEGLAEELYNVYGESAEWKNYQGLPMPTWNLEESSPQLPDNIKKHWIAVAASVRKIHLEYTFNCENWSHEKREQLKKELKKIEDKLN